MGASTTTERIVGFMAQTPFDIVSAALSSSLHRDLHDTVRVTSPVRVAASMGVRAACLEELR